MFKKNKGVMTPACICFALIFIVLWAYYNAAFGEKRPEKKKEISVVLYDSGVNGWDSLLQGIKQAEEDFSVKINYITTKSGMTGKEQLALVQREIENGVQGVLLAAVDSTMDYQKVWPNGVPVPVITIESGLESSSYTHISADDYQMGWTIGKEILEDCKKENPISVYVMMDYKERDSVKKREQGLRDALGTEALLCATPKDASAVVALCKESLQKACEKERALYEEKYLYGIGNTSSIVAAVDKGVIKKLVFQNEFNMGYLAVKTLMNEMNGIYMKQREVGAYCVEKKELYQAPYEQLLFPNVE